MWRAGYQDKARCGGWRDKSMVSGMGHAFRAYDIAELGRENEQVQTQMMAAVKGEINQLWKNDGFYLRYRKI